MDPYRSNFPSTHHTVNIPSNTQKLGLLQITSRRSTFSVFVPRANNSSCNVPTRKNEMDGLKRYKPVRVSLSLSKTVTCRNISPFRDDGGDDIQRRFPDPDLPFNVYNRLEESLQFYTLSIPPPRHRVVIQLISLIEPPALSPSAPNIARPAVVTTKLRQIRTLTPPPHFRCVLMQAECFALRHGSGYSSQCSRRDNIVKTFGL